MKCIVLFGGKGKRVSHLSENSNKGFIGVNGKPVVYYIIKNLLQSFSKEDLILVTNSEHKDKISNIVNTYFNFLPTILCQENPLGVPDAISLADSLIVEDFFSVCLGDFYSEEIPLILKSFSNVNQLSVNKVSNPKDYGILFENKVIEKPTEDVGNLAVRGFYIFNKEIFSIIPKLRPSKRNETEISDLINQIYFKTCEINSVFDLGSEKGIENFKRSLK